MPAPRIFVDQRLAADERIALGEPATRHCLRALRLRSGDPLLVFNGDGRDWHATLTSATQHGAQVQIDRLAREEPESNLRLHLMIGISRGERMDYAIQKAVELGVHRVTPLRTQRVMVKLDSAGLAKRRHHWQGIVISACEQSGRSRLPVLEDTVDFPQALQAEPGAGLLLDPLAERSLIDLAPPDHELTILVGPEGGLTSFEHASAVARGYQPIRLGPRVLRTETAPLAALAAVQILWGDFR